MRTIGALGAILAFLLATRLAQSSLVWVEEAYPSAAAGQMLAGKALYRDIWFDKPPLSAAVYLLWGARPGVPLRLAGALFVFACSVMAWFAARRVWSEREGIAAAALLAVYLTFGVPAAVMALAPDLLLVLPHLAAVYLAWRGRPFASGIAAGIGMLVNTKAVFVLAACLLWQSRAAPSLVAGFALPNLLVLALPGYWEQVWQWGWLYSRDTFVEHPLKEAVLRTGGWAWFHSAALAGAALSVVRERRWREAAWMLIALAGVAAGLRFFPRYYFLLLPPACILAARAFCRLRTARFAMAALLLIPVIRFGPRLFWHENWADAAMMEDSRQTASILNSNKQPGDTLLVWGYRPDVFVFTGMPAGTRFLDSQPLTGVIADRHLTSARVSAPELAARSRAELLGTRPSFIVDGLGLYNPALAITRYPDLREWLAGYHEIGRTKGSIVYGR